MKSFGWENIVFSKAFHNKLNHKKMRTSVVFFIAIFSFFLSSTGAAQYSYKQKGTRFLVGKERPYFGSEKIPGETGPFFLKINPSEVTQNLGEIFPQIGLNGRGLFYNFDPKGIAHICELEGTTKVVRNPSGKVYAVVCGNLLLFIEAFEGEKSTERISRVDPPAENFVDETPRSNNRTNCAPPPAGPMVWIRPYYSQYSIKVHNPCPGITPPTGVSKNFQGGEFDRSMEPFQVPLNEVDFWTSKKWTETISRGQIREYTYMRCNPRNS